MKAMTETRTQPNKVAYSRYGKLHVGVCHLETGACFICGKTCYMIRDFPLIKTDMTVKPSDGKSRPKIQGSVFAVTEKDAEVSNTVVIGILCLFSHDVRILIDLRSTLLYVY